MHTWHDASSQVAAKKLDRRLAGLGAAPLLERGLGDDQHPSGYEAELDRWLPKLWAALRAANPLPLGTPVVRAGWHTVTAVGCVRGFLETNSTPAATLRLLPPSIAVFSAALCVRCMTACSMQTLNPI